MSSTQRGMNFKGILSRAFIHFADPTLVQSTNARTTSPLEILGLEVANRCLDLLRTVPRRVDLQKSGSLRLTSDSDDEIEILVALNSIELGSPRPSGLLMAFGVAKDEPVNFKYLGELREITEQFYATEGETGEFSKVSDKSKKLLMSGVTDLITKWLSSPYFQSPSKTSNAFTYWTGSPDLIAFANSKTLNCRIIDWRGLPPLTDFAVERLKPNVFLVHFSHGVTLAGRVHTGGREWKSTRLLDLKISFTISKASAEDQTMSGILF